MNKSRQFFKKFQNNAFFKTYLLILLPVLITLVFFIIGTYSNNKSYKELVKHSYLTKLEAMCNENEVSLQSIDTLIDFLVGSTDENDDSFNKAGNFSSSEEKAAFLSDSAGILSEVTEKNLLIDSIFVYDRDSRIVYSDNVSFSASSYFFDNYCYAEYDKMYWDFYASPSKRKNILAPSLVSTPNESKIIIPIVFATTKEASADLIVVNVSLSQIINNMDKSKLTQSSTFLVMNSKNRNLFNADNSFDTKLSDSFYDTILSRYSSVFDCDVNGRKNLVISYSTENSFLGYYYVTLVPYSDINNTMPKITYFILILGLIAMITLLAVTYFSTNQIYTPIENLVSLFKNSSYSTDDGDTWKNLHASIQQTLDSNTNLSNQVSKALPLIQERFLINLLNSNEHYIPHDDEDMPIDFKHENFCSIVIKLRPTDMFYNMYNNSEYNAIKSGIHNIISSSFGEFYDAYIIPSEADTLYVLLNLPDDANADKITEILLDFQKAMDFDKEYMTLKIGIGGIYPHLEGLKKSHHEAVNSVSSFIGLTHLRLYNDDDEPQKVSTYILNMNDENTILNHLILGRTDDAKALIDTVLKDNAANNISQTALMQLYVQLLNLVFKVMRMKNISYDTLNNGDFHMISEIIKQPLPEVHDTLIKYIDIIGRYMNSTASKVDIQAIVEYMENNYQKDIGLDSIADNFNTSPKYLSKLIKDKLGVNFVDYLAGLRINAAKILLCETNKNISDIFVEVGFNNRNTFIRSFKKNTGLTPTEFRKSEKK